jgi:hypothetical protein
MRQGKVYLLVFMNPEQAEQFRGLNPGWHPESEGFSVKAVEVDELEATIEVWGYEYVALCGPEPDRVSYLKSADFIGILEEQEELLATERSNHG